MSTSDESSSTEVSPSLDVPASVRTNSVGDGDDVPTYGSTEDRNRSDDEQGTADDVDPRGLFNTPTLTELRWYYRHSSYAGTIVDKPVKDAFKNGFEIHDDPTNTVAEWLEETYVPKLVEARIKARRDGFSFIFWNVSDTSSVSEPVQGATGVNQLNVLTIDDLTYHGSRERNGTNYDVSPQQAADGTQYDTSQLDVTRHGIVVVDDIREDRHEDIVGVMYETDSEARTDAYEFIHEDRLQHFVSREYVDGEVGVEMYGGAEGDSLISLVYHPIKALKKAEWALGQTLLRYTAPLHVVEMDDNVTPINGDIEEHLTQVNEQLDGITNKSNITLPPGHQMETHGASGDIDPTQYVEPLVEDLCAGSEMTKSVLMGTQTGTVSGSSTDIKNYYNQVRRFQTTTASRTIREAVEMQFRFDKSTIPSFALGFDIEWNPLFEIEDATRLDAMRNAVQAVSNGTSSYLLTVEEARDILEQQWATLDVDVDLPEIGENEYDELDRVNVTRQHSTRKGEETEEEEFAGVRTAGQNGGGRESSEGTNPNTTDPADPTTAET